MKSKLAEQLREAAEEAAALNRHAAAFGTLKGNYASDIAPGGGGGGGGGSAAPGETSGVARPGARTGTTIRTDDLVNDPSTRILGDVDVAGEAERLAELAAAARWFGIPVPIMLRASRAEQDRLLEQFRAIGSPGYEAGFATQGSGSASGGTSAGVSRLPPDITGGAAGQSQSAYTPLATQRSGVSEASSAPAAAVMAGAQATVAALGSVVKELKRLNDRVAKEPRGMALGIRTGEVG